MKSAIKILQSHLQTILSIMSSLNHLLPLFFFFFFTLSILNSAISQPQSATNISVFSSSNSPWRPAQNQTLLSPNATFAAGFLPVPNSPGLYTFSVWFRNVSQNAVVWSATNRPVSAAASLLISRSGELRLVDSPGNSTNLWPSRPVDSVNGSGLSLRHTGNLVYGNFESFDSHSPTNTIIPNQPINGTTLVSSNGKYMFDSRQLVFIGNGRNDNYWTNFDNLTFMSLDDLGVIVYGDAKYYASDFGVKKLRKLSLDDDGNLRLYSYDVRLSQWIVRWQALFQLCTVHGTCGANSICMYDASNFSTSCVCPPGYTKGLGDSCQLKIPLSSSGRTKFLRLDFVNFTGGLDQNDIGTTNFTTCEASCLSTPNCLGFMFKYDGSNFCVLQLGRMVDGYWSPGTEMAMFLRVDESESDVSSFTGMTSLMQTMCPVRIRLPEPPQESRTITRNIVLVCALFVAELLFGAFFFRTFLNKYIKYRDMARTFGLEVMPAGGPKRFSYAELKAATNNFSNPIGKGGFGIVYMGKLSDGRVVAVKSLKNITGGDADFWAEVTIIARMHHLNLVRLWGFCAEKGSRILVYEYVPNGSLDEFLFQTVEEDGPLESEGNALTLGSKGKPILDWNIRYRIALGVARAIAYLHEECLEWVLHCDIKPENILLGDDFCPKVSDFGLAKLKKKEDMISMSRIRGTPGYMAPEWARPDQITSKADVYSYGLVLLEIVSGSRNFAQLDSKVESDQWFLPGWAYDKVFKEMSVEDVLDQRIKQSYDSRAHFDMVNRMVKTAMWCLQERPEARPSMGKVAKMLEGTVEITPPNKPNIFYLDG